MTDEEYVSCRDQLIPEAEKYADKFLEEHPQEDWDRGDEWSRIFLRKMDDLAVSAGLVEKGLY